MIFDARAFANTYTHRTIDSVNVDWCEYGCVRSTSECHKITQHTSIDYAVSVLHGKTRSNEIYQQQNKTQTFNSTEMCEILPFSWDFYGFFFDQFILLT